MSARPLYIKRNAIGNRTNYNKTKNYRYRYSEFPGLYPTPLPIGHEWTEVIFTERRVLALEDWVARKFVSIQEFDTFNDSIWSYEESPWDQTYEEGLNPEELTRYLELYAEWTAFKKVYDFEYDIEWYIFIHKYNCELDLYQYQEIESTLSKKLILRTLETYYVNLSRELQYRQGELTAWGTPG
jgi:hypothetical protein